ncbi:MAG: type II/IV secretion system protein, partial [Cyanobacteria bacterium M_surface_7_m2_040]|nr:type II/IV secretion system protein [Cyanobacteria bacterium M_surface_7_m2_040]
MTLAPSRPVPDATTADQQRLEVELLLRQPVLGPEQLQTADPSLLGPEGLMTLEQARQIGALPLLHHNGTAELAVPTHWSVEERQSVVDELSRRGVQCVLRLALAAEILDALESWGQQPSQQPMPSGSAPGPMAPKADQPQAEPLEADSQKQDAEGRGNAVQAARSIIDQLDLPSDGSQLEEVTEIEDLESSSSTVANASPVVSLVDRILIEAIDCGASDIHVEPQEQSLEVRFRLDGVLQKHFEDLPKTLIPAVTSRLKIMADLDIAERRLPQDGRIRRLYKGKKRDFRVSTLPSRHGEKVVMRLLDSSATQQGLDALISNPAARALVRDIGSKPFGMILVTGPTGSGKSTTLYSLLAERNDPGINISTVEDPIEYSLPGITQTQVNRDKGLDFSTALRAFMRQDPDVLLVGETRDLETAKTAIEAALTGHLVLTSLHCNDAPSAIARLDEMGVEPFMVSASLLGIVSQRLLRRVCTTCRESYRPTPEELSRFGLLASTETNVSFFKAKTTAPGSAVTCPKCQGSGYKGRVGVYEVLRMNEALAAATAKRASTDQLRRLALENGMKSLLGYGLDLVREGHTTLEEVERMLLTDSGLESERRVRALNSLS